MRYSVSTIRDGKLILGNTFGVNAVWTDVTLVGAVRRANYWAKKLAKPGDILVLEAAPLDRPYAFEEVKRWTHARPAQNPQ